MCDTEPNVSLLQCDGFLGCQGVPNGETPQVHSFVVVDDIDSVWVPAEAGASGCGLRERATSGCTSEVCALPVRTRRTSRALLQPSTMMRATGVTPLGNPLRPSAGAVFDRRPARSALCFTSGRQSFRRG